MADQLLSSADIKQILQESVDKIKGEMKLINFTAISLFYSGGPAGSYNRVPGFFSLDKDPEESWEDKGVILTYTYSAGDVSVNSWDAPWGVTYPGSSEWAFDTGFVHGIHGGPRPAAFGWTWNGVAKSASPWETIVSLADSISI